jgi:arylsulfatase A-like enzyme
MSETRPNIVIILSDDQGYADVRYHGYCDDVDTPHTDALAASGVRLTDGYASAYVCAPTQVGLLTGHYQQRFGFYKAPDSRVGLPTDEITVADLLKDAGYNTSIF